MNALTGRMQLPVLPPHRAPARIDVLAGVVICLLAVLGTLATQRDLRWAGLLAAPVAGAILVHRPQWALWATILLIPASDLLVVNRLTNYVLPALVLLVGLGTWLRLRFRVAPLPGGLGVWFVVFVGWILVCCSTSDYARAGFMQAARYAWLGVFLVVMRNAWSPVAIRRALIGAGIVTAVTAGLGIVEAVSGSRLLPTDGSGGSRLTSIYNNPNAFGLMCATGITILCAWYGTCRPRRTLLGGAAFAGMAVTLMVLGFGLLGSLSRAAMLYVAAALVTLSLATRWWKAVVTLAATAGAVLVAAPLPSWLYQLLRLKTGSSERGAMWTAAVDMMKTHPWTGLGAGNGVYEAERSTYIATASQRFLREVGGGAAHNAFLTKGAELGVLGLVLLVALFVLFWLRIPAALRAFRAGRWEYGCAAAGMVGLTVRAFFETWGTAATGHISDSLMFFLFGLILLTPPRTPSPEKGDP